MTEAQEDFEALFDEVAAQRTEAVTSPPPSPVSEMTPPNAAAAADADADVGGDETAGTAPEGQSDKPMYERLGGIVRMLHDSLRELGYDRSLSNVANQITDAQDRLEYVATLTEQAANKVLNAVDSGMPEQDALAKKAKDIDERWADLFSGKMSIEEFKAL